MSPVPPRCTLCFCAPATHRLRGRQLSRATLLRAGDGRAGLIQQWDGQLGCDGGRALLCSRVRGRTLPT